MIPPVRRVVSLPALLLLAMGAGLSSAPGPAAAAGSVAALRGAASSLSARYGAAVPLGGLAQGLYLIPTRTGFEIREASQASGDSVVATFRTAGRIEAAAVSGATAWLAAGSRGLLAVDLTLPAAPVLLGSYGGIGTIRDVAVAQAGQTIAASSDSTVYLFFDTGAGAPAPVLRVAHRWTDGRIVRHLVARNDSILVAAERPGVVPRLYLTLLRAPADAPPESLWEFQANGHQALDVAWRGGTAFLADGMDGVLPFQLSTRQLRPPAVLAGNREALALDADDSVVVVVGSGDVFARFHRAGSLADSLIDESDIILPVFPVRVRLAGSHAIFACDSESDPAEPDEVARSMIQDHDLSTGVTATPVGPTGRVRRVVTDAGLAYVADYKGGLRIYRAGSPDTSLVGSLPPAAGGAAIDLALDAARHVLYLASGVAGVEIVDVTDPAVPARIAGVPLSGDARCVAVIGDTLLAAGFRTGSGTGGVTFIDVRDPSAPLGRGSVTAGVIASIADPRALAPRDTVLFVADDASGVISVTFGNPDAPGIRGVASGAVGTQDVSLFGTTLLAATQLRGVQVVDASVPTAPVLRSEVSLPPVYGVAQQGSAAVAFLGDEGAVVIDLSNPASPVLRGAIESPGFPRDGAWSGDTLLVASSFGLERFTLPAPLPEEASLALAYDSQATRPRITASWPPVSVPGVAGLFLYREGVKTGSDPGTTPVRINGPLLPAFAASYVDDAVPAGGTFRYRLMAALQDGGSLEIAVGTIFVGSAARMGRPFPNPFRPASAASLSIPFRSQPSSEVQVHVRIYDVHGRLIRSMSAAAPPGGGFTSVAWDGRDQRGVPAAAGLYLIHVRAPGIDDARTVVLLR